MLLIAAFAGLVLRSRWFALAILALLGAFLIGCLAAVALGFHY